MIRAFAAAAALAALVAFAPAHPRAASQSPAVPSCPTGQDKPDVSALVGRLDQLLTGRSSIGVMTMSIKTPSWTRSLKMKVWAKGKDFALVRVLEGGPRETGMMTLKREKQLWNWLPQAGRVLKLPSGMMGDAWLGSDFTNDDLVKGNSLIDDFDAAIKAADRPDVWQVTLTPKPSAAVVWGRIDMAVDRKTCVPVSEQFFDEDGKLARHMTFADFREVGWRHFPARMSVVPSEKGRETSIYYSEIQFDVDIPDDTFSLQRLRQGR